MIGKHVGIKTGAFEFCPGSGESKQFFLRAQDSREERREERRRMEEALQQEYASRRVRRCGGSSNPFLKAARRERMHGIDCQRQRREEGLPRCAYWSALTIPSVVSGVKDHERCPRGFDERIKARCPCLEVMKWVLSIALHVRGSGTSADKRQAKAATRSTP